MTSFFGFGFRRGLSLALVWGTAVSTTACMQTVFIGGGGGEGGSGGSGGTGTGAGEDGGGDGGTQTQSTSSSPGCDSACSEGPCDEAGQCQLEAVETCTPESTCARGECLEGTCRCAISIAGSPYLACAVVSDGSVWCGGDNSVGQTGNGTTDPVGSSFVKALAPAGAVAVATSGALTCALHQDASVSCWGLNFHAQTGAGYQSMGVLLPVTLPAIGAGAAKIMVTDHHACALDTQGKLYCWGNNGGGQTGTSEGPDVVAPAEAVNVSALGTVVDVDGDFNRTCALLADGTVWCFGKNDDAPIGDGSTSGYNPVPVQAAGLDQAVEISVGTWNTCARRTDGTVWCWGIQLEPTVDPYLVPAPVPGMTGAVEIGVGRSHVCLRKADGTVWCRGSNIYGEIGVDPPSEWEPPTQVLGLPGPAVELSVQESRSCARLVDDSMWCWGATATSMVGEVPNPTPEKLAVPCP